MDQFRDGESVALLVDVPALSAAIRPSGLEIDYAKLLDFAASRRRVHRAIAFTALDQQNPASQAALDAARRTGYRVVGKTLRPASDGSLRAYLGIEMAVELILAGDTCDVIVLATADPELLPCIRAARVRGARIELIGCPGPGIDDLAEAADVFIPLADVQNQFTSREKQQGRFQSGPRRPEASERKEWPTPPPAPPPSRTPPAVRPVEGRRSPAPPGFRVLEGERLSRAARPGSEPLQRGRETPGEP